MDDIYGRTAYWIADYGIPDGTLGIGPVSFGIRIVPPGAPGSSTLQAVNFFSAFFTLV